MKFPQAGIDAVEVRGHSVSDDLCTRVDSSLDILSDIVGPRSATVRSSESSPPRPTKTSRGASVERAEPGAKVFDPEALMGRCVRNLPLAKSILHKFKIQFTTEVDAIRQACDEFDCANITRLAHRLKGASASVSAERLQNLFSLVEEAGRNEQVEIIPGIIDELLREWDHFWESASTFIQQGTSGTR